MKLKTIDRLALVSRHDKVSQANPKSREALPVLADGVSGAGPGGPYTQSAGRCFGIDYASRAGCDALIEIVSGCRESCRTQRLAAAGPREMLDVKQPGAVH